MKFRVQENHGDRKIKREKKNVRGREVERGRKKRSRGMERDNHN